MNDPLRATCPHCPGSSRLFVVPHGLNIHIGRKHKEGQTQQTDPVSVPVTAQAESIDFNNLCHFKKSVCVLKHIPKGARCLAAGKLSQLIDKCVDLNTVEDWWALLTYAYTALRVPDSSDKRSLTTKVKENIDRNFCYLAEGSSSTHKPLSLYQSIATKVYDGDLRGAVRLLVSDCSLAPRTNETLDALKIKHPPPSRPLFLPPEPDLSCPYLSVTVPEVSEAICSFQNGSAAGLDGLRPEHLKELISLSAGDNGRLLLESLTRLSNFLLRGLVNREVCPFLYGASLVALNKKDGGIRPIAVGSIVRRMVARLACRAVKSEMSSYLQPHQLGFGTSLGCEAAIHATRAFAISNSNTDNIIVKLDIQNAFNSLERDNILSEVMERVPSIYPFLYQCYSTSSNLYFGDSPISSVTGTQQGDPLGPLIFSLAMHKVIGSLESQLNIWYLDDGTVGGRPEVVSRDIQTLIPRLENIGLRINMGKCEYFACNQNPSTIIESVLPGIKSLNRTDFKILGAPVFSEAIPDALLAKEQELLSSHEGLKRLPSHVALTLLRSCLSMPKLNYTIRTAPVWLHQEEVSVIDSSLRGMLESILNISMSEEQWHQASLPIRHGGLGIRRVQDTALPAFLASMHGALGLVTRILNFNGDRIQVPFADEALSAWTIFCPDHSPPDRPEVQRNWDDIQSKLTYAELLNNAADAIDISRLRAVSCPESGAWLHALPSPQLGTFLDDDSLRFAVGLRLGCNVCEPHRCTCGAQVEANGHHGLSCSRCEGRFPRHHALNDIIRRALITANIPCTLEPPGLSRTDGKRPDGLTLVPWERGRSLLWDATCVSTYAASHIIGTSRTAGSAAESAARQKHLKYDALKQNYIFIPFAVETSGVWGAEAKNFIKSLGRRLVERGYDRRCGSFLVQRLSLAIQRGNAAGIMGTFGPEMSRGGLLD